MGDVVSIHTRRERALKALEYTRHPDANGIPWDAEFTAQEKGLWDIVFTARLNCAQFNEMTHIEGDAYMRDLVEDIGIEAVERFVLIHEASAIGVEQVARALQSGHSRMATSLKRIQT